VKLGSAVAAMAAALCLSAGVAPAVAVSDPIIYAGTTYWYWDEAHTQLAGYQIVECNGVRHGPYPGPGEPYAWITEHEVFVPLNC
jgi:hypothetical protein